VGDGDEGVAFRFSGTEITGAIGGAASSRKPSRRRQASRSPPSAYRIRSVTRRPGGPARLRATSTSVRWPTTSRPRRIHDRRASSSRMPVASPTARVRPPVPGLPPCASGGSSTTRLISARRASAANRPSRSANARVEAADAFPAWLGRSMTSRSTARPARSEPAIDRPSSASAGVSTTSHSGLTPRATTSTGSRAAARSSQATIEPAACAAAASRSASVVRPLDASPRSATPMPRGTPPGPRMASSSANPVETTRSKSGCGIAPPSSSGTVASAPTTSPAKPGAAAPQRVRSVARAALRSASGAGIGCPVSNKRSNESTPWEPREAPGHSTLTRLRVTRRRNLADPTPSTPNSGVQPTSDSPARRSDPSASSARHRIVFQPTSVAKFATASGEEPRGRSEASRGPC
jgi:hypothetical protein